MNYPLKRFNYHDILEKMDVSNSSFNDKIIINNIPHISTSKGIYSSFSKHLGISKNGDFIIGIHITNNPQCQILKYNFETSHLEFFDYEHLDFILCIMLNEQRNLVISGDCDKKLIVHDLQTKKIKKIFQFGIGKINFLYDFYGLIIAGGYKKLKVIDQDELEEIKIDQLEVDCKYIYCMKVIEKKCDVCKNFNGERNLLLGGESSGKITKIDLTGKNGVLSRLYWLY